MTNRSNLVRLPRHSHAKTTASLARENGMLAAACDDDPTGRQSDQVGLLGALSSHGDLRLLTNRLGGEKKRVRRKGEEPRSRADVGHPWAHGLAAEVRFTLEVVAHRAVFNSLNAEAASCFT